jgi:LPS sulfotransferase NodH
MSPYQVISERELNEVRWDQVGPSARTLRNLWLCTTPRSGSWLLARQLLNAGIGVPHEYLTGWSRHAISGRLEPRPVEMDEYLRWLMRYRRTENGVFAMKVHWWQLWKHWTELEPVLAPTDTFVHLHRRDVARQAVSLYLARASQVWTGVETDHSESPTDAWLSDFMKRYSPGRHAENLEAEIERLVHANTNWQLFFARRGVSPVTLEYESYVKAQPAGLVRIAEALSLEDVPSVPAESSRPPTLAALDDARHELLAMHASHYATTPLSVKGAYRGGSLGSLLVDAHRGALPAMIRVKSRQVRRKVRRRASRSGRRWAARAGIGTATL